MAVDPRRDALAILCRLDSTDTLLDQLLSEMEPTIRAMPIRDRSLFQAIVFGVTRWRKRLDFIIHQLARSPEKPISQPIRNLLRMGLFQLIYLDRIPDAAIAHTTVALAKTVGSPWAAGFVNGLLRTAMRRRDQLPNPSPTLPVDRRLAIAHSFPRWMVKRWIGRFGEKRTEALCESGNSIPPITIRTNTLRCTPAELAEKLQGISNDIQPTSFSSVGFHIRHPSGEVASWPGFEEGWFQVQDEAAQLVCDLLAPLPGHKILDACAGIGGKTGALAALSANAAMLVATDQTHPKLKRLRREMKRLGATRVAPYNGDSGGRLPFTNHLFDRVLVDAPCSGIGVIRRNPDIKWRRSPEDLVRQAQRQYRLLSGAASQVASEGRMVYTVCSIEPEETVDVVNQFLETHPNFNLIPAMAPVTAQAPSPVNAQGLFYTFPDIHCMDGFFAAVLEHRP